MARLAAAALEVAHCRAVRAAGRYRRLWWVRFPDPARPACPTKPKPGPAAKSVTGARESVSVSPGAEPGRRPGGQTV